MSNARTTSYRWHAAAVLLAISGLTACGSDDNAPAAVAPAPAPTVQLVPGTDVPVDATTTVTAAQAFVKEVVATPSATADQAEGLELGNVALATNETDEPDPDV
jgi:hypothetical protein